MATKTQRRPGRPGKKPAKPEPKRALVTQAEYARHRQVTPQTVSIWRRKGRLVTVGEGHDLRVDVEASDKLVDETRDPQHDHEGDGSTEESFAAARTRRELANAKLAELKLAEEQERLVDRAQLVSAVYDLAKRHQQALLNLPARVASTLAARLGADEHATQEALEELVREHLREQGRMALRLKSAAAVELEDEEGEDAPEEAA